MPRPAIGDPQRDECAAQKWPVQMAQTVYLLGAGVNYSLADQNWPGGVPPLANNLFQVLIEHSDFESQREWIRDADLLLEKIERYWHLDLQGLRTKPFDIEECLTLFESQWLDAADPAQRQELARAAFALRQLLHSYLSGLPVAHTPTSRGFGQDVLAAEADVLTFNYDSLAEQVIASASRFEPDRDVSFRGMPQEAGVPDEDLGASYFAWRPALAYGFKFDEVPIPVAGRSRYVTGERYYAHPGNQLYDSKRVLKLHGSIDWLRYADRGIYRGPDDAPSGKRIVLERNPIYLMGEPPERGGRLREPIVIPPHLYKDFRDPPFPRVWEAALETLSECKTLFVVGYSFPPTDFRTVRLFREAFSEQILTRLVVVNPHPRPAEVARQLTNFRGTVETRPNLGSLYDSWTTIGRPGPTEPEPGMG
jgi:SIR2-like domain